MATKSIQRQVKDMYPDAVHVKMGIPMISIHTIYKDGSWSKILGQSTYNQKEAWINALNNIKKTNK